MAGIITFHFYPEPLVGALLLILFGGILFYFLIYRQL